jgi:hypothetical protein
MIQLNETENVGLWQPSILLATQRSSSSGHVPLHKRFKIIEYKNVLVLKNKR